ncbi:MAG: prepilin-type N-terminal cleavage/methylation domain-containing protein [Phycisphaerales bacterium]|nr:prepilin-type N-terminal cleavage/methylation domain-containing protein [Phycisphaerales bacterium]
MKYRASKAFTLVEILIVVVILGILAAIVIPQFTNASEEAQSGNVKSQLQTIRSQIELFRVRNNGQAPVLVGAADLSFTDLTISGANSYGTTQDSYMRIPAVNPRTGTNDVVEDADPITTANAFVNIGDAGWLYNSTTGAFAANGFCEVLGDADYGKWKPAP